MQYYVIDDSDLSAFIDVTDILLLQYRQAFRMANFDIYTICVVVCTIRSQVCLGVPAELLQHRSQQGMQVENKDNFKYKKEWDIKQQMHESKSSKNIEPSGQSIHPKDGVQSSEMQTPNNYSQYSSGYLQSGPLSHSISKNCLFRLQLYLMLIISCIITSVGCIILL